MATLDVEDRLRSAAEQKDARNIAFEITDLRQMPWLAEAVADRLWRAWWRDDTLKEHVRARVQVALQGSAFPQILVAHQDGSFVGTVSVVDSNMAPRRDLTPWLSALWVDECFRENGVGNALINTAISLAKECGREALHLMATPQMAAFYERRGWQKIPGSCADVIMVKSLV
ncbi:GNAT family N-acetyltransferase [Rhizobium wenxiniae]|uniref:GNAT family N-acetyltransferase n=1 Tax=Rhizobium wenxiniae TaxID=1737357 RepID=UPI003C198B9A